MVNNNERRIERKRDRKRKEREREREKRFSLSIRKTTPHVRGSTSETNGNEDIQPLQHVYISGVIIY